MSDQDDNIPSNGAEGAPEPDLVPMDTLDEFVDHLVRWHNGRVNMLKHYLTVPNGMELEVTDKDGKAETKVMTGDLREGFIWGINLALSQLGNLPFVAEVDAPDEQPHEGAANDPIQP